MKKDFIAENWKEYLPKPICETYPAYKELYEKTWELARAHVRDIKGMPQTPYMDEAFCDTQVWILICTPKVRQNFWRCIFL